ETWTGAIGGWGVLVAAGRVFVAGNTNPGVLWAINPTQPAGGATPVAVLGNGAGAIAFDGVRVWSADVDAGTVSIATPGTTWTVTSSPIGTTPTGIVYDGSNMWATDSTNGTVLKLSAAGAVLQTVSVGGAPKNPVFDGTNLWVPVFSAGPDWVTVVRAST